MILFIAIQIEIYAKMCHLLQQCILKLFFIGIKKGEYSVLYMSPETLLDMEPWGHLILHSRIYQDIVTLIAIDEAHILESW